MTQATIQNATVLLREIESLPSPEQTEYIKMMRHVLMGLRLAECTSMAPERLTSEQPVA